MEHASDSGQTPKFIVYVYPGWHDSEWRPGFSEWDLLDSFNSYSVDHLPVPRPTAGRYDDSEPSTVRRQIGQALEHGITAFTYFLYCGPTGFVMADPLFESLTQSEGQHFLIAATWCLRLPHNNLPIPRHSDDIRKLAPLNVASHAPSDQTLTIADVSAALTPAEARRLPVSLLLRFAWDTDDSWMNLEGLMNNVDGDGTPSTEEVRESLPDSPTYTFWQLRRLAASCSEHLTARPPALLTMGELEDMLHDERLQEHSLGPVIQLIHLWAGMGIGSSSWEDVFDRTELFDLARVSARSPAVLSLDDVVGLGRLAARGRDRPDILESTLLGDVEGALSAGALMKLSMSDLRRVLEGLASASS